MIADTQDQKPTWQLAGAEKREGVRAMFASIAGRYDELNDVMSLRRHGRWRRLAVAGLGLKPGGVALDLCCGTGDFARELRSAVGSAGQVIGVDFCEPMLSVAREKGIEARFLIGDATAISFASESFDAVAVGWGIRNVADIDAAHREIFRVLRPGRRFVSLDMARPRSALVRGGSRVFARLVPALGRLFGHGGAYRYLIESTERFWSRERLAASMEEAGFVKVGWRDLMLGNVCMHFGQRPGVL